MTETTETQRLRAEAAALAQWFQENLQRSIGDGLGFAGLRSREQWLAYINDVTRENAAHPEVHEALRRYAKTGKLRPADEATLQRFIDGTTLKLSHDESGAPCFRVMYRTAKARRELYPTAGIVWQFVRSVEYGSATGHPPRIKSCANCGDFFFDESQNYRARFCRTACRVRSHQIGS